MIDAKAFQEKVREYVRGQMQIYPCKSNRASMLGGDCNRLIVYWRTRWQEAAMHSETLESIFREGRLHEDATITLLRESGFQIIEQQRPYQWKEFEITGHVDGKIVEPDRKIPFEIKGYASHTWAKLNSIADFLAENQPHYIRKAPVQLNLYLWMDNVEEGLFILKNKGTGELKFIPMPIDIDLGDRATKQAVRINEHIAAGTLPDRMSYDPEQCDECSFVHLCLPDVANRVAEIGGDELEKLLAVYARCKPFAAEYEAAHAAIKELVKEKPEVLTPLYRIVGKWIDKKGLEIKPSRYWQTRILPLGD